MEVDPVQQGAGDLLHILGHLPVRTGAPARGMPPPAAPAGVHGAHQLESGGQVQRPAGAGHGHGAVLQGLAQGLQHIPVELRQLVQEQYAVVGQGDLSRPQQRPAAGQGRGGGGVVRTAEGPAGQQRVLRVRQPRHGPDSGDGQRLLPAHIRQDGGQPLGQHGLARAGRADQQQVVAACRGDLQGPFGVFLPHHVPQVRAGGLVRLRRPRRGGGETRLPPQVARQSLHVRHTVDCEPFRQRGLGGIFRRDIQLLHAGVPGRQGHGQHAGDAPQRPGEGQLPDERRLFRGRRQLPARGQQPHKYGQIVDRARLFLPGGGQVHGDPADGELGPAVLHRRPYPLPGLPHGGVRQAHDVKGGQAAGEKTLGADLISRDAA